MRGRHRLNFDFTGVVFGGGFDGAWFSGGMADFTGAEFSGGTISFQGTEFRGSTVYFQGAKFSGGEVSFGFAELGLEQQPNGQWR